ncbi:alpha/beta hydrolase [Nocardia sp. NPDC051981]|uniref:alpha/beta fold hydrolase n=1 Tax=Nocardia sp. NPDC051981 TaxID=3155417 RepID=UPI00343DA4BE
MPFITLRDGAQKYYKDWGDGRPVIFSHGWPLNADAWDTQANLVAAAGFRAIAHDRHGHGRLSHVGILQGHLRRHRRSLRQSGLRSHCDR